MRSRLISAAGVLSVVLLGMLCQRVRADAPSSGYIQTVTYAVSKAGKSIGQKRYERIWFSGRNTRRESLIGDNLTSVTVTGDTSWVSAPAAGRILSSVQPDTAALSVPESARRTYARLSAAHPMVGNVVWNGHPCWKHTWHEPERRSGDIMSGAYDVTKWVYADKEFPVVVRSEASYGGVTEMSELKMNCPVPKSLFKQPADLSPVFAFNLPKAEFKIAVETHRLSLRNGWMNYAREVFTGDREQVMLEYHSTQMEANGRTSHFDPPKRTFSYENARIEIANRLQSPMWFAMKKAGQETIMGLQADVLKGTVEDLPEQKWWVVNHPLLGTISLKRDSKSTEEKGSIRVTEITIK